MIICPGKSFISSYNDIANLSFLSRDTLTAIKELAVHIRHMPQILAISAAWHRRKVLCQQAFSWPVSSSKRDQIHGICYLSRLFDAGHSFLNLFCICHSYTRLSSFLEFLCCCKNLLFQFIIQNFFSSIALPISLCSLSKNASISIWNSLIFFVSISSISYS